jgi:hypothetical protein
LVGASIGASVWGSVRDSVGAYISSLFPGIRKWKYIDHPEGENPFQSCIDLWNRGFLPIFNGKAWMLLARENRRGIIMFELKQEMYCNKCKHYRVCKYITEMEKAMKIAEISELKDPISISPKCNFYQQEKGAVRICHEN